MPDRRAIVLVLDQLGTSFLGPYGNTWCPTPSLNRFASQSVLFENAIADASDLASVYRSYWTGRHATDADDADSTRSTLTDDSLLITDDCEVARHPHAGWIEQVIEVSSSAPQVAADSIATTEVGRFFATAVEEQQQNTATLTWVHARAMGLPWDAPTEFREMLADEDEPLPDYLFPTCGLVGADADPDELWGAAQAYAAQVAMLDACLEPYLDFVTNLPQTLVIITSPRGFPLGEHGVIGGEQATLHCELTHLPLLIRFPDGRLATERLHSLVQPDFVHRVLTEWLSGKEMNMHADTERAVTVRDASQALRIPAWKLIRTDPQPEEGLDAQFSLYVKPDDRFEANDVASRCNEVIEQMNAELDVYLEAAQQRGD